MGEVFLNLDYGSSCLKATWQLYEPRVQRELPAFHLAGEWKDARLLAADGIRNSAGESLKEWFLSGKEEISALDAYRTRVVALLKAKVFDPVREAVQKLHPNGPSVFLNVHTPLRLRDARNMIDSGIFDMIDAQHRLAALNYRDAGSLGTSICSREITWANWITSLALEAMASWSLADVQVAFLPESLTVVNNLTQHMGKDARKQFLVLDVGHFTTDYCLAAFDTDDVSRLVIRQASSIFQAGSRFIEAHGFQPWIARIMEELRRPLREDEEPHAYMDLALLLIGGGALLITSENRFKLLRAVETWLFRDPQFKTFFLRHGKHKIFLDLPPASRHLLQPTIPKKSPARLIPPEAMPLHLPSFAASGHAEHFCLIRVPKPQVGFQNGAPGTANIRSTVPPSPTTSVPEAKQAKEESPVALHAKAQGLLKRGQLSDAERDQVTRWLEDAARLGHRASSHRLGIAFLIGELGPVNIPGARLHLWNSTNQTRFTTLVDLGDALLKGDHLPKAPQLALNVYLVAAEHGEAEAHLRLADLHSVAHGSAKNKMEAINHLRTAASLTALEHRSIRTRAQTELARLLLAEPSEESHSEALDLLFAVATPKNRAGSFLLGQLLLEGKPAIEKNHPEARKYLKSAAEEGHEDAECLLAYMQWAGLGGPAKPEVALVHLKRLRDRGNPLSRRMLRQIEDN